MTERQFDGSLESALRSEGSSPGAVILRIPLREFGRYDDVAEAALFLIKSGRYITGETLVVDGGRQLNEEKEEEKEEKQS